MLSLCQFIATTPKCKEIKLHSFPRVDTRVQMKATLHSATANPSDQEAAKEEGRLSNGDGQLGHSQKEPKAQSRPI